MPPRRKPTPAAPPPPAPPTAEEWGLGGFQAVPEDQGLSLEEIGAAFASLMQRGADPYTADVAPDPQAEPPEEEGPAGEPSARAAEAAAWLPPADAGEVSPRGIVEALLFVGRPDGSGLTSRSLAALMRGVSPREVEDLIRDLNEAYAAEGCPYVIEGAEAGFRLALRPEWSPLREKFLGRVREARLSQHAIDVLSLVAYRQPVSRSEIDELRGRPSGPLLAQLVRRDLLHVERTAGVPEPHYRTTERFLELFGLDDLTSLPRSQELER